MNRWLLLIGVLTGLFFSSGEGIHLLPFPEAPAQASQKTIPCRNETYIAYSFSVHNAAVYSAKAKSKVQKDFKDPACVDVLSSKFQPVKFRNAPAALPHSGQGFSAIPIFLTSPSDRGPPII